MSGSPRVVETSAARARLELAEVQQLSADLEEWRLRAVADARRAGVSWREIGEALGMTRQSAWGRFATQLGEIKRGWDQAVLTDDQAMGEARRALAEVRQSRAARTRR